MYFLSFYAYLVNCSAVSFSTLFTSMQEVLCLITGVLLPVYAECRTTARAGCCGFVALSRRFLPHGLPDPNRRHFRRKTSVTVCGLSAGQGGCTAFRSEISLRRRSSWKTLHALRCRGQTDVTLDELGGPDPALPPDRRHRHQWDDLPVRRSFHPTLCGLKHPRNNGAGQGRRKLPKHPNLWIPRTCAVHRSHRSLPKTQFDELSTVQQQFRTLSTEFNRNPPSHRIHIN